MSKNLVIVESPAKAKTLEKFLGKDYQVEASGGHVRDLPPKKLGVNIDKDFEPAYQTIKGKEKTIKNLKDIAGKKDLVLLAPDPDREGEAIAWHLASILGKKVKIKRIEFNEITKGAVQDAVKHPRDIDINRVNAQQARRILDRLVGYKISPILWKKIRKGLSAGRVQSVAVKLICIREKEISDFKSEEYWSIIAVLESGDSQTQFPAKIISIKVSNKESTDKILSDLKDAVFKVEKVSKKEQKRHPYPPFITSTLQQEASRKLGFSAKKTMVIAQQLYEGVDIEGEGQTGLITYMRTDSVRIAATAIDEVRTYINEKIGPKYLPQKPIIYKTKKQAQDAHEAVRPTLISKTPESISKHLTSDQNKLYKLIWNRFVASQIESAILLLSSADIKAGEYTFRANGSTVIFDGYKKIYEETSDTVEEEEEITLPDLIEGENLKLINIDPKQHFTEPLPRYTEATLVKELEKSGIGRPSTYAPIVGTIQDRGYVIKEARTLKPTELGMITNEQLTKHFPAILDIKFTAHMEDTLDNIAEGLTNWVDVLKDFYGPFEKSLALANVEMEKIKKDVSTDIVCEKCGSPVVIRSGRYGDFLACSTFPKCKFTKELPGAEKTPLEEKFCEKCGKPMQLKRSRFGQFWACSGYPECKSTAPMLKKIGVKCPKCEGDIIEKKTRKKRIFYSCINYPKCDYSSWTRPQ